MDFTGIFSLKSRSTFFLLVAALCLFSLGAWWAVSSLVWSEVRARLLSSADRIEASIRERLANHGNNLVHIRAFFQLQGVPSAENFRLLVEQTDLFDRHQGARGIGYAPLMRRADLPRSELVWPKSDEEWVAPVKLLEPVEARSASLLGYDMYADSVRRKAIDTATRTGEVSLSGPIQLLPRRPSAVEEGFLLYAPIYRGKETAGESAANRRERAVGILYAPFLTRDFFQVSFGPPSLQKETVNFVVTSVSENGKGSPIYNRFDYGHEGIESWAIIERPIRIFGQDLVLKVYPLPQFYSFADRYLALIVGLAAALVSCMVMVVMRVSQSQLEFEVLAKESSMEAALQSRRQLENLRKLNEFDRQLAGELGTDSLIRTFSTAIGALTEVEASFLFFKKFSQDKILQLREHSGIDSSELRCNSIPANWLETVSTQSLTLRKGDAGAEAILASLLSEPRRYSDWILSLISTREGGRCGLMFAARKNGAHFSEVDRELFESMLTQFAVGVEISQLFLRVEDASKAKNAFLANMSHEIRTPLSAIIGFSEILTHEGVSPDQKIAVAENLRKNGSQLTCIIDDILDLSKVEAGKLKVERKQTSLSPLIQDVKSVMELRAQTRGIRFTIETVGKIPTRLETDEVRLKQVLMNIIGNAIKFTERGEVRLIVRCLPGEMEHHNMVFTVKDSGIGISEEAQGELFRPFSQGDMSNTRKFGGSGLGLALSKRLAQQLGGDVMLVDSIRGQGSTFEIRVDAGNLAEVPWLEAIFSDLGTEKEENKSNLPRLDGAKILVVEDSEDNQEIFRYFLEGSGAKTDFVGDGNQAVLNAQSTVYDMILMDIQIPGIDGKEATRRIRRQGFRKPIVALTAHAMPEEQTSCLDAGCNGQITKPVSGDTLVSQVAEFLRRA